MTTYDKEISRLDKIIKWNNRVMWGAGIVLASMLFYALHQLGTDEYRCAEARRDQAKIQACIDHPECKLNRKEVQWMLNLEKTIEMTCSTQR